MDFIYSHHDTDGIVATHLIRNYLSPSSKVIFQPWWNFGITEEDLPEEEVETIYVADLGVKVKTLETLSQYSISHPNTKIILFDHHEPVGINPLDYATPNFQIIHNTSYCSASLVYLYLKATGKSIEPIDEQLTIIAIHGDVAVELQGCQQILASFREKYPEMFWNYAYWSSKGKFEATMPIPALYSRFIGVGKRMAFEKGAEIGLKALEEIKRANDLSILENFLGYIINPNYQEIGNKTMDVIYPNCAILKYWYKEWIEARNDAIAKATTLDFPNFTFALVNYPLSVASWIAFVKSQQKPCIALNYGIHSDYAEMSGRSRGAIDLVKICEVVNQELGTELGGHKEACGGAIPKSIATVKVIQAFEKAFTGMGGFEIIAKELSEEPSQ